MRWLAVGYLICVTATSLITWQLHQDNLKKKLLDSRWSRFLIPLSGTAGLAVNPGDIVNFEVVRANGTSGDVSVYRWELQYNNAQPARLSRCHPQAR